MKKLLLLFFLFVFNGCSSIPSNKDNQCLLDWRTEQFTCHKKSSGRVFYNGEMIFVNEVSYKHGIGKEFYKDGSIYEGSFEYGVRNGMGEYTFPTIASCSSLWREDRQFGEVTCKYFEREEGHLRKGNTDGSGNWIGETVYIFPDGSEITEQWENGILSSDINK